jgi:Caspase domain
VPSLIPEDLTAPGTHALVIGASRYRHLADGPAPTPAGSSFDLEQLSAAARSASEFAAWLLAEYRCPSAPLKSLRVLLSPSPGEQLAQAVTDLANPLPEATIASARDAIGEFRHACDALRDNVGIVYVAGHGVQLTKTGAILLLTDFGAPGQLTQLEGALDMAGIHAGMNHPGSARTQFWFVDACRQRPAIAKRFEAMEGALKLDVPNGDTETSPLFLAAATGTAAFARPGGLTLFADALLWALRRGALAAPEDDGVSAWHVPVTSLIRRLPDRVQELAAAEGAEQSVDIAGKIHDATLQQFAVAPIVDLRIDLEPEPARQATRGTLRPGGGVPVVSGYSAWPLQQPVSAGLYMLSVEADAPFVGLDTIFDVRPPATTKGITVGQ